MKTSKYLKKAKNCEKETVQIQDWADFPDAAETMVGWPQVKHIPWTNLC